MPLNRMEHWMSRKEPDSPLPEVKETLSEGEERFDRRRKKVGLLAGPILAFLVFLLPLDLPPDSHRMAGLLTFAVIYWITEPIPIAMTALLGPFFAILLGIGKAEEVLASFGHPILFVFIGSFLLARAMEIHRLDRRFSLWLLSMKWVGNSPYRLLWMVGFIAAFMSMWISNTAATAMIFPIALGILASLNELSQRAGSRSYATALMLMVAYSASVGGIGTPIGSPPNLIGIGMIGKQAGRQITFFEWMSLAIPILIVMYIALYFLLVFLLVPRGLQTGDVTTFIADQKKEIGSWSRGEKNALFAFLVAVFLWIVPGILALIFGTEGTPLKLYNSRLPEGGVAIFAASFLFFLPTDWGRQEFTLSWRDASQIDWGTILLFGGGLALGDLMFKTGLSRAVGEGLFSLFSIHSLAGVTGMAIFMGIVVSELTSNTAAANMVVPVIISLANASGVSPIPPAIGATLGASYGFMLPISTPPNAIVYSSGLIPIGKMMTAGILFDAIGFLIIWGGLMWLCPLLGLI